MGGALAFENNSKCLEYFCLKRGSSQGQNLALTVLCVPNSLDGGGTGFRVHIRLPEKREFLLPWREAGPPNHDDDKVDSDQQVVNQERSFSLGFMCARGFERLPRSFEFNSV